MDRTTAGACIGAVVGLVAITPAAGYVSIAHSIPIGVAASIVSNAAVHWKTRSTLDDTLGVFPGDGALATAGRHLAARRRHVIQQLDQRPIASDWRLP